MNKIKSYITKKIIRILRKMKITDSFIYKLHKKEFRFNFIFSKLFEKKPLVDQVLLDINSDLCRYNKFFKKLYNYKNTIYVTDIKVYSHLRKNCNSVKYIKSKKKILKKLAVVKYVVFENKCPDYFIKAEKQIVSLIINEQEKIKKEKWEQYLYRKAFFMADNIIALDKNKSQNYLFNNNLSNNYKTKDIINLNINKNSKLFFNKTKFTNNKKTILFYPSYLMGNGVTETLITLLNEIDYDKYDVYVAVIKVNSYKDKQNRINEKANILYFNDARFYGSKIEHDELIKFFNGKKMCDEKYIRDFCIRNNKAIVSEIEFDYVIDYNGYSPYISSMAAYGNKSGKKIIYLHNDLHNDMLTKNYQLINVFYLYQYYDKLVSVSEGCYRVNKEKIEPFVLEKYNFSVKDKMTYILNPVNYEAVVEGSKQNNIEIIDNEKYLKINRTDNSEKVILAPNSKNINFVSIGRLSPEKNFSFLIDVFYEIYKKNKNIRLYIIGMGVEWKHLNQKIEELEKQDVVIMVGYTTNPYELLGKCDCLILPSLYEGLGMVVLEAMILNKYVISSDIEGPREIVKDEYGKLVNIDKDSFIEEINNYITSKKTVKKFDYVKYNKDVLELFYKNVLERNKK